jgi:hypothetical protein
MKDILIVIVLSILAYQLLRCEFKQPKEMQVQQFCKGDTLKIFFVDDSITEIKPLK